MDQRWKGELTEELDRHVNNALRDGALLVRAGELGPVPLGRVTIDADVAQLRVLEGRVLGG
eukprot:2360331-Prymnesium_polylepis.1